MIKPQFRKQARIKPQIFSSMKHYPIRAQITLHLSKQPQRNPKALSYPHSMEHMTIQQIIKQILQIHGKTRTQNAIEGFCLQQPLKPNSTPPPIQNLNPKQARISPFR
jgi:hypothetical protein